MHFSVPKMFPIKLHFHFTLNSLWNWTESDVWIPCFHNSVSCSALLLDGSLSRVVLAFLKLQSVRKTFNWLSWFFSWSNSLLWQFSWDWNRVTCGYTSLCFLFLYFQSVIFHVERHPKYPQFSQCVTFHFFPSPAHELAYNLFNMIAVYGAPLLIIIVSYSLILIEISRKSREGRGQKPTIKRDFRGRNKSR